MVQSNSTQRAESQVTKTAVIMILAFLLTWMPYAAFALTKVVKPEVTLDPRLQSIPMYMAKTGTIYNPVIHICLNKQVNLLLAALRHRSPLHCLQGSFNLREKDASYFCLDSNNRKIFQWFYLRKTADSLHFQTSSKTAIIPHCAICEFETYQKAKFLPGLYNHNEQREASFTFVTDFPELD